jgi:imidazolonepropionase
VRLLVEELIPRVGRERLAEFCDVFCEPGVFSLEESEAILLAARAAGLGLKVHADELDPYGGAELAARLGATSADHLGAISAAGVEALAASDTVAVILPGTLMFLGKARHAPARALVDAGAVVAVATDFNPGSSPSANLPLMMALAVSQARLQPAEAFAAATVSAARAVGRGPMAGASGPGERPTSWCGTAAIPGSWPTGTGCRSRGACSRRALLVTPRNPPYLPQVGEVSRCRRLPPRRWG